MTAGKPLRNSTRYFYHIYYVTVKIKLRNHPYYNYRIAINLHAYIIGNNQIYYN